MLLKPRCAINQTPKSPFVSSLRRLHPLTSIKNAPNLFINNPNFIHLSSSSWWVVCLLRDSPFHRGKKMKNRGFRKISIAWFPFFCFPFFLLGMLVTNRIWSVPESNGQVISRHRHEQELQIVSEDNPIKMPAEKRDMMTEVYRTNEAIKSLDKKITMLNMDLVEARNSREVHSSENYTPSVESSVQDNLPKKKMLMVIGINTAFSSRRRRDSVRETWMPRGEKLFQLEREKGIVVRFMIGHRYNCVSCGLLAVANCLKLDAGDDGVAFHNDGALFFQPDGPNE